MNSIRNKFTLSNSVTFQLICHYLPWFIPTFLEKPFEESLGSFTIPACLQQNNDYFTVLVNCSLQITLFTLNLDKYFIKEESIAVSLMLASQLLSIY